jgi:signal transduction histidine kinase
MGEGNFYSPVYEKKFLRKDGSVFFTSVRIFVVSDKNGKPLEISSVVSDVIRREQTEGILSD